MDPSLAAEPVRVGDVTVAGLTRTRASVVKAELGGVERATTFGGLVSATAAAVASLESSDLFESVSANVDRLAPPALVEADAVAPTGVRVRLDVHEKRPYALKVGATTAPNDGGEVV